MAHWNDPDITPIGFLYAVMHDNEVSLKQRMIAANKLMRILPREPEAPREVTVLVRLGVPPEQIKRCQDAPRTVQDVKWLERCKKYGLDPASYFMGVQGHG